MTFMRPRALAITPLLVVGDLQRPLDYYAKLGFTVTYLDAELTALTEAGIAIDKPIHDTFYEMRELEVVDPDGYRACFGADVR